MRIGPVLAGLRACAPTLLAAAVVLTVAARADAQPPASPVHILDVPYIQQTEALCGGAASAMVMRYWGATGVSAESFATLVDESARGIRGEDLLRDLAARGWDARSFRGDRALVSSRLADRQPVIALIEDRPGYFHFIVIVAWANGRVIYHDPARAPFRVIREESFESAWERSSRWTMLLLPPSGGLKPAANSPDTHAKAAVVSPCADLVAEGVKAAERGDRAAALDVLTTAAAVCPTDSAPLREAAGVHALNENWSEAGRLARAAVERDPSDAHAWRILATSAYLAGDAASALTAWNAAGEPLIDLITVQGLDRTRHAVATGVLGLHASAVLTSGGLAAARRRLADLPSADVARVNYRPLGSGKTSVEAVVVERPKLPTTRGSLLGIGARLLTERELSASAASLTGGGELLTASWRWWRNRPRLELAYAAPSRAGIWHVQISGEEQSYGNADTPVIESRRGGAVSLSQWTSTMTRWELGALVDSWGDRGRTAGIGGSVDQRFLADRVSMRGGASVHGGAFTAWTAGAGIDWRSVVRNEGTAILGRAGIEIAAEDAPRALWPGAGAGHARVVLLRAHPLLHDGRIDGQVFGRRLYHGSAEVRRWSKPVMKVVRLAPAAFVDLARAERRPEPGHAWSLDAGAGLRIALPGSGVLRLDVAKGLRDGATALSVGWER